MEFEKAKDGHIQANWAQRIGQVHDQYKTLTENVPENEKFEATLTITLLNGLLCYAKELIDHKINTEILTSIKLNQCEVIHFFESKNKLSSKQILDCLRNAISHPLGNQSENDQKKVTGFTSYNETNTSGQSVVAGFVFTHSPCVKNNGEISCKKNPFALGKRLTCDSKGKCVLDGIPLNEPPYIQLKLSVSKLSDLVSSLSAELSSALPK